MSNIASNVQNRQLIDLNLHEFNQIASRVTGKKSTVHNTMGKGAEQVYKDFNLARVEVARAANLICCTRGMATTFSNIQKSIGKERMQEITPRTPANELFAILIGDNSISFYNFNNFLYMVAVRQEEIESICAKDKQTANAE